MFIGEASNREASNGDVLIEVLLNCSDRDGFNRDGSSRVPVEKVLTEVVPIPIEMFS